MANPFAANDPAKLAAQRARQRGRPNRGGGGGGNRNRNNNRNRGGGGGNNKNVLTNTPTTEFAKADPQAFFRGMLEQAGFDPNMQNGMGDFLNQQAANFQSQWNAYQTNPANAKKTLWDYVRENSMGVPEPYISAQNAQGGYVPNPADWQGFQQRLLAEYNRYSPTQLGTYDTGKQPGAIRYNLFA